MPARQLYAPDDAHARPDRQRLDDVQGRVQRSKCNQTGASTPTARPHVVHLSNLCTEILEVTDQAETAVCNLGSINLGRFVSSTRRRRRGSTSTASATVVRTAVPFLDRVIDINYYPTAEAGASNPSGARSGSA